MESEVNHVQVMAWKSAYLEGICVNIEDNWKEVICPPDSLTYLLNLSKHIWLQTLYRNNHTKLFISFFFLSLWRNRFQVTFAIIPTRFIYSYRESAISKVNQNHSCLFQWKWVVIFFANAFRSLRIYHFRQVFLKEGSDNEWNPNIRNSKALINFLLVKCCFRQLFNIFVLGIPISDNAYRCSILHTMPTYLCVIIYANFNDRKSSYFSI